MHRSSRDPSRSRPTDSWIEVSTQSPSAFSSNGNSPSSPAPQSQRPLHPRRRRHRPQSGLPALSNARNTPPSIGSSSQDEYDESESESDRVMTSSNEEQRPYNGSILRRVSSVTSEQSDEHGSEAEDDAATALGILSHRDEVFTPQPNAFSHPPLSQSRSHNQVAGSYFPRTRPSESATGRHSYPGHPPAETAQQSKRTSSYQADHDAALRASLTTLLSCAAAARSLPKSNEQRVPPAETRAATTTTTTTTTRVVPTTLRMIPESELLARQQPPPPLRRPSGETIWSSPDDAQSPVADTAAVDKGKRKATRSNSKDRRIAKKARRTVAAGADDIISPTLLTWVVSAGVLVLVSALSFSVGYSAGRESARLEMVNGTDRAGANCAGEIKRGALGLRRLRSVVAA